LSSDSDKTLMFYGEIDSSSVISNVNELAHYYHACQNVQKWYWCGSGRTNNIEIVGPPIDAHHKQYSHLFEKEPNSRAGIKIAGLSKIFGDKIAVNNLHLNFYENQVTALLGHNGTLICKY